MPVVLASSSNLRQIADRPQEEAGVGYWQIVWIDYASIVIVAAFSLFVYYLPMYQIEQRLVPLSRSISSTNMDDALRSIYSPPELSYPTFQEPLPSWACAMVVVFVPLFVISIFQFKLRSLWDFHAGLTGTLKAVVAAYVPFSSK